MYEKDGHIEFRQDVLILVLALETKMYFWTHMTLYEITHLYCSLKIDYKNLS